MGGEEAGQQYHAALSHRPHIEVDQVKFQLLKEGEGISSGSESSKEQSKEEKKKTADLIKKHDSGIHAQ